MKQIIYDVAFFSALAGVTYKLLELTTKDDTITEIQMEGENNVTAPPVWAKLISRN